MGSEGTLGRIVEVKGFVAATPSLMTEDSLRRYARLIISGDGASEGATSEVLKATNSDGETLALKVMRPTRIPSAGDALALARERAFHEEYLNQLAISGLRGFPEVYGYGTVEGRPAIVMEWVEGTSLHDAFVVGGRTPGQGG